MRDTKIQMRSWARAQFRNECSPAPLTIWDQSRRFVIHVSTKACAETYRTRVQGHRKLEFCRAWLSVAATRSTPEKSSRVIRGHMQCCECQDRPRPSKLSHGTQVKPKSDYPQLQPPPMSPALRQRRKEICPNELLFSAVCAYIRFRPTRVTPTSGASLAKKCADRKCQHTLSEVSAWVHLATMYHTTSCGERRL